MLVTMFIAPLSFASESDGGAIAYTQTQNTVMEMAQRETRIAELEQLARERKAVGLQAVTSPPVASLTQQPVMTSPDDGQASLEPKQIAPKVKAVTVLGIFGLGTNLVADLRIDDRKIRFQRGYRYPLGEDSSSAYTLIYIKTPCVKYVDSGVTQTVCIDGISAE